MALADFKSLFPNAKVMMREKVEFCFGRRLVFQQPIDASAVGRRGDTLVRATFHPMDDRLRLTSLVQTETIGMKRIDSHKLRILWDRLIARYGPFSRLLMRRKMEPEGRIVGFVWSHSNGQTLRVEVHEDHARNTGRILVDTRLSGPESNAPEPQPNKEAIEAFDRDCERPKP